MIEKKPGLNQKNQVFFFFSTLIISRFVSLDCQEVFFVLLFCSPARWQNHLSFPGPARPVGRLSSHLPVRPGLLKKSPLICWPGPLEKSPLIFRSRPFRRLLSLIIILEGSPRAGPGTGPCRPLLWGHIFEMEKLMDLRVLRFLQSKNHVCRGWSVYAY